MPESESPQSPTTTDLLFIPAAPLDIDSESLRIGSLNTEVLLTQSGEQPEQLIEPGGPVPVTEAARFRSAGQYEDGMCFEPVISP